jgi:pimeloyl-ACP methyl ester carboxylesterase
MLYPIYKKLLTKYRLVLLDQLGWGASTRIDKLPADVVDKETADLY